MKNIVVKFLSIFLVCIMILPLWVGCAEKEPENDKLEETGVLLQEGCKIVYPGDIEGDMFKNIQALQSSIHSVSRLTLELSTDFVKNEDEIRDKQEIIVGNTFRSETKEVMDSIGYYGYAIKKVGSKIVIAAHTEEMLYEAMGVFAEKMLNKTEDGKIEIGEDLLFESEKKGFFEKYGDLSKYRIVIPTGESELKSVADEIATTVKKRFSAELAVVTDSEAPNGYEILIGSTNRAAFADYYRGDKKPDALHFSICAREGNILIYGGSQSANEIGARRFLEDNSRLLWSYRFDLPCDIEREYAAYDRFDAYTERTEGTDIRIMSYNMLSAELSPTKPDFSDRADKVLATVLNFMPDVVGIQEVSEKGYGIIESLVGDTYAIPLKLTPEGKYSYTGLMYNKNTVNYIEGGNHIYSVGNRRIRIISWGLFELKASGKKFIAVSTHWDANVSEHRPQQAVQLTDYVNDLKAKYNCPIFTTGDFNTRETADYYQNYLKGTGQVEARYSASLIAYAADYAIDHINATQSDTEALLFKLIDTEFTAAASDHDPIFADYKLK